LQRDIFLGSSSTYLETITGVKLIWDCIAKWYISR